MNPTELITGQSLILLGILVVVFVFVLRRTILGSGGARGRKDASSVDEELALAEAGAKGPTEMLEVRLHDFAREVEGRMLTRIAVLDRLIVDADREIRRLQELLAATTGDNGPVSHHPASANRRPSEASTTGGAALRQPDATVAQPAEDTGDRKEAA